MNGVVNGVFYCNQNRTTQLSNRMFERNVPNVPLQMNYDPRPVDTRFVLFPALDCRTQPTVPRERRPVFNPRVMFSPGTSLPFSGFQKNVDNESKLQNIIFPLQTCPQAKYIPGTSSDMFDNRYLSKTTRQVKMTNPYLFTKTTFAPFNPNTCGIGHKLFNNFTRVQTRGLGEDSQS